MISTKKELRPLYETAAEYDRWSDKKRQMSTRIAHEHAYTIAEREWTKLATASGQLDRAMLKLIARQFVEPVKVHGQFMRQKRELGARAACKWLRSAAASKRKNGIVELPPQLRTPGEDIGPMLLLLARRHDAKRTQQSSCTREIKAIPQTDWEISATEKEAPALRMKELAEQFGNAYKALSQPEKESLSLNAPGMSAILYASLGRTSHRTISLRQNTEEIER